MSQPITRSTAFAARGFGHADHAAGRGPRVHSIARLEESGPGQPAGGLHGK